MYRAEEEANALRAELQAATQSNVEPAAGSSAGFSVGSPRSNDNLLLDHERSRAANLLTSLQEAQSQLSGLQHQCDVQQVRGTRSPT